MPAAIGIENERTSTFQFVRYAFAGNARKEMELTYVAKIDRANTQPGIRPPPAMNVFASSYYIIRIPNENASWEALLKDHAEKGGLTDMTDAERKTFRQRYPGVRPVPKQWLNLYGLTGKRYLMYLKGPGLMLFVR